MSERICDNCMSRIPADSAQCPKCGIEFENTNPGGALPNGWVVGERYTIGPYVDIDGEGVTYSAIDGDTMQWVTVKEFMPVTLCASRGENGEINPKPGCEVLFKTTRMDFSELYGILLRLGLVEGLVQVLDVIEENNTAYAILERIEGPTLAEFLTRRKDPIESARALALLKPILNGVEAMHTSSLVHRGISPENIILESGGTAKLTGYGTLALRQQGSELKPKLYPGFSAPEQYAASEFEGKYTDIYALGAILYRLVTGIDPESADERKMQDNQRPARAVNREVPAFLSAGISRAMRIIPAERLQTVAELRLAFTGESQKGVTSFMGLTKQQLIVAGASIGAIIIIILIIILVSVFSKSGKKPDDSSSVPSSSEDSTSVSIGQFIPDVTGKLYDQITQNPAYTDNFNFEIDEEVYSEDVGKGRIISQTPKADTDWNGERVTIKCVVSKGMEPVDMPDFLKNPTTQAEAEKKLKELGISYTIVPKANDGSVEPGLVVGMSVQAGTKVEIPNKETPVKIEISSDVQTKQMLNLVGISKDSAISEMERLGVANVRVEMVGNEDYTRAGKVSHTEPAAGSEIAPAVTNVVIYVYDTFRMPDLNGYVGQKPDELFRWLDERKIGRKQEPAANDKGAEFEGTIARIDHVANGEVTSGTVVTVYVYGGYTAPEPPPDSGGDDNSDAEEAGEG